MKTIVIGLGNPILGDDGVGWKVAEMLELPLDIDCLALGGLSLMERLVGYERAILIDAIQTGEAPIGTVRVFRLEDLPDRSAGHTGSLHDMTLPTALKLGRSMGAQLPETIFVVGIEAAQIYDFSEALTPPVSEAIPQAAQAVRDLLSSS